MNCDKCQDLISDFLDGSISHQDRSTLSSHLEDCLHCAEVRDDLQSIVGFCRTQRGQYEAPPNEKALWLRIRNMIEAGASEIMASQIESLVLSKLRPFHGEPMVETIAKRLCHQERAWIR